MTLGEEVIAAAADYAFRPLDFVLAYYKWDEGILKGEIGPDQWQAETLDLIGEKTGLADSAVMMAIASGHGIGKTALLSWVVHWFISTRPHPQIVVTSNTQTQLLTKTWRELAKWHNLSLNKHAHTWTATRFYNRFHPETWFASAIPWSKERSEAFAGTHEAHVLFIYDEASLIDDSIWEVTEGAMTTPGALWLAFGNPTRNVGRFRDCFDRYRHRWITRQIDSRTSRKADKVIIGKWIEDYGEDSDFVRVRVKGEFPRAATSQFIGQDLADAASARVLNRSDFDFAPIVMGVDVARFGDDMSVIYVRQGLCTHEIRKFRGLDTMQMAAQVSAAIERWKPQAVFVDEVGIGAGVVDRLRQLGFGVVAVNAGSQATMNDRYFNLRAEMWDKTKDWLKAGGLIPDDRELKSDLVGPEYGFDAKNRLQLERKEDMKSRGVSSPDVADALAMTFAYPVQAPQHLGKHRNPGVVNWLNKPR